jgi:hypothetical protein
MGKATWKKMSWVIGSLLLVIRDLNSQMQEAFDSCLSNGRLNIIENSMASSERSVQEIIGKKLGDEIVNSDKKYNVTLGFVPKDCPVVVLHRKFPAKGDEIAILCMKELTEEYGTFSITLSEQTEEENTRDNIKIWIFSCFEEKS